MAPKTKAKKGKKGEDDVWAAVDASVGTLSPATGNGSDLEDQPGVQTRKGLSGYTALAMSENVGASAEDPEEDFGGLMSIIKATEKNKKDKKKVKKVVAYEADESVDHDTPHTKQEMMRAEATVDDSADEEGLGKRNSEESKKVKRGGDQKNGDVARPSEIGSHQIIPAVELECFVPGRGGVDADLPEEGGTRLLSKKEKEKLKKEREKAKKKAQAATKVSANERDGTPPAVLLPTEPYLPQQEAEPEEPGEDGEEAGDGKVDSKKKKKKKPKKAEEIAPAPPPGTKKKGGISALKALMEEKKRLEEEARRREDEERQRIEEEERKAEEEKRRKEEEKQRRKEKEKTKRDLAKKEGRLLTKKQKDEKMMAERRKQALLASGVQIEGLQNVSSNKKVVYGTRKKKGPEARDAPSAPASRSRSPELTVQPASRLSEGKGVGDDLDAGTDDQGSHILAAEGVKESWEVSSEEEGEGSASAPAVPPKSPIQRPPLSAQDSKNREKVAPESPTTNRPPSVSEGSDDDSSGSDSEGEPDSSSSSSSDGLTRTQRIAAQKKAEAAQRRAQAHEAALAERSKDNLRSPICCILGHVDTGKTKLLDKIRQTNVQEGEAGGITQQIGATYFPVDAIKTKTTVLNRDGRQEYKIPGLLVIDTPGHESFTNLRSRGSSLCNIAILVVDIMHGLEPQTLESLRLLRERKTPFIVALNKIDRMYGWTATPDGAFQESLTKQKPSVQSEFKNRVEKTIVAFAEQGLNAALYYENDSPGRTVSLVPTSAITGEGIPDMIMLLVNLTQQRMSDRLMYLSELECTVLEVKVIEGLGTTIDVVLSNGILREGDRIVVCGLNGPIVTQIRALLTPQPLRELRVKSAYVHHKEVKAALGIKITAPDLEKAIAGSRLLVVGPDEDEDDLRDEVMSDLTSLLNSIDKSGRGVCVQASTLGSLEALLDFLKASNIPVSGINIGPVYKRDIMRSATMLEKAKELACILCFDVPVDKDAERLADEMGVRLFRADIIYHLFDAFTAYNAEMTEAKRRDAAPQAVWPCRLKVIAAFCKRDPIILGVDILDGSLRVGTPLAVVKVDPNTQKKEIVELGKITSLEINHKTFDIVKKSQSGGGVAVKIEHAVYQSAKLFGRHFDEKDEVLSHISRQSIDVLKNTFKADVTTEEWQLIRFLKPRFNIP